MYLDISGMWYVRLETDKGRQEGDIRLPGILQAQGYGEEISYDTVWVSGLYDSGWWMREEYGYAQEAGVKTPFLAQPPKHFLGRAFYNREIVVEEETEEDWYLFIEITHWKTTLYVDGEKKGSDCSLCTAHSIRCGRLSKGVHRIMIEIDNSMQYPYRPDGHSVSDALGATWNGMAGELALFTERERKQREIKKRAYADAHPRHIEIKEGKFYVDGRPEYFRGTHFGGDYPLTGYPITDITWWREKMQILKDWGLNFIRCHSYCPPDAAFAAADEEGIYIQPECGMWNYFEEGIPMLDILRQETKRILCQFGHHPSFVLFSPTNEPSGNWYGVLREWVEQTRAYDESMGYAGRRVYTAQTGWFYDVAPEEVEGVDYLYFHRSAYGPYLGGTIRGSVGWRGGDYSLSLGKTDKPVICHELGQWCAYPDFDVIDSFTGYLQPGNYEVFRENCRANGLLPLAKTFAYLSGRSQVRLYKEDVEANLRTPQIYGFELLDIRDYLGQGTALVGLLDAFWKEKGYVRPEEFRQFCAETVLLAAFSSYVYALDVHSSEELMRVPVSVCHFGKQEIGACAVSWELWAERKERVLIDRGTIAVSGIPCGQNTSLGIVEPDRGAIRKYVQKNGHGKMRFRLALEGVAENEWKLYVYDKTWADNRAPEEGQVWYTQDWQHAKEGLRKGKAVVYAPFLSELHYECPPLSIKNIFWNGQMGPSWGRSLGMVVENDSPLFEGFPTDAEGGWQWEDILARARGFCMQEGSLKKIQPIVRIIDDWNRNLPLALVWEARVENGKLLVVSADLSGEFGERPAAYAFRAALCKYAASPDFAPKEEVQAEDIVRCLFPVHRMEEWTDTVEYMESASVADGYALIQANPNAVTDIRQETFPVVVTIKLKRCADIDGILYVPDQRERERTAFPKDVELLVWERETKQWASKVKTTLPNSIRSQEIRWKNACHTDSIRLVVNSCYGEERAYFWEEYEEGYRYVCRKQEAVVRLAGIHILCGEEAAQDNRIFWEQEQTSTTKEIEA